MSFPGCAEHYIMDESGTTTKTGVGSTLEELAAHPTLQNCNIEALRGKT